LNDFDARSVKYQNEFEKEFGTVDPNQDWSMATRSTANFNLSGMKGNAIVNVFNGNPNASRNAKILGSATINNGIGSFNFYSIKGVDNVYVQVKQDGKTTLTKQCALENGNIFVGEFATRAFSGDDACPTTQRTDENATAVYTYFKNIKSTNVIKGIKYPSEATYESDDNVKTLEGWVAYAKANVNQWGNGSPFTDASIYKYVKISGYNFDNVVLKGEEYVTENADGTITYYFAGKTANPSWLSTQSVEAWQYNVKQNYSAIIAGTYSGPWTNESLKGCFITETCDKNAEGAMYGGLTDESTWVLKDNISNCYANVQPTFQYLNDVEKDAAPGWNMATGYSFFGDGNFFAESVSVWNDSKLGKYYDTETMKKMEQGYSILTTENQVIELPFVFGVTAYTNQFGYIYYKAENEDKIDPIALKHFVLIEDGRPSSNLYRDTWQTGTVVNGNSNGSAGDWFKDYKYTNAAGVERTINFNGTYADKDKDIVCYCSKENHSGIYSENEEDQKHLAGCYSPAEEYAIIASKSIIGTSYRPMFFGEKGDATTGSYQWPAGYKIIFWINTLSESTTDGDNLVANHPASCFTQQGGHFNYSIPALNHRLYHEYQGTITEGKDKTTFGQVQTISWSIKNSDGTSTTFLAFGDNSGDKDLNDMVFMVTAPNDEPDATVVVGPVKWHLNYNQSLDVTDGDLFDFYSLNIGASYTNPKKDEANSEPQRPGYEFIGWSTEPKATTGVKDIADIVHDENGAQYFAIWRGVGQPTVQSWIFACEDLGGSYDYDFNDIIWEISQESVENEDNTVTYQPVKVKLLASGGQLPVKLIYGTQIVGGNELHQAAYNGTANEEGRYTQVNVYSDVALVEPAATWELEGTSGKAMNIDEIKSKIKIWVDGSVVNADDYYVTQVREGDKTDVAPQILILPGDWCWPTEGTNIKETYNNFVNWVKDTKDADWYHYRVAGKFVKRF